MKDSMKITRILNYALIIAVIVSAVSFILPIVPCKTAPIIAEPEYTWQLCKLPNPFSTPLLGISMKYYGSSEDPFSTLVKTFLIVLLIAVIIFAFIKKRNGKIIDLSNKKR